MPVQKTALQLIPTGVDTKASPFHVAPGAFVLAENVRFKRKGEVRKRAAYANSISTSNIPKVYNTQTFTGLGVDAAARLYLRGPVFNAYGSGASDSVLRLSAGSTFWEPIGLATSAVCEATISVVGVYGVQPGSTVTTGGELPNGFRSEPSQGVLSAAATTVVVSSTALVHLSLSPGPSSSSIRIEYVGYASNGSHTVAVSTPITTVVGTSTAAPLFDAVYLSSTAEIAIAYRSSATAYTIASFNPSTQAMTAKVVTVTADSDKVLAFLEQDESAGRFYLGVAGSTAGVRVMEHSISTFAQSGTQTISAATLDARQMTGFRSESNTTTGVLVERVTGGSRGVVNGTYVGTGTGTGSLGAYQVANAGLYSRAFRRTVGSKTVCNYCAVMDGVVQNTALVCDWTSTTDSTGSTYHVGIVGRALVDSTAGPLPVVSCLPRVSVLSNTAFSITVLARKGFDISGTTFLADLASYRLLIDFDQSAYSGPAELGGLNYPGGLITASDVGEVGFPYYPEISAVTPGTGGSLTPSSTYTYACVFRKTSENGDVHRSAPSVFMSSALGSGSNSVSVAVKFFPADVLTDSVSPKTYVDVYRTAANGDGTALYKCASVSWPTTTAAGNFVMTVVDNMADSVLLSKEKLYTTGDVLETAAPPASKIVIAWKNRLVAVQRRGAWISREYSPGFGVSFSDTITVRFDDPGGDVTACAIMEDRLYFHRAGGLWALAGEGPDDRGGGQGYDRPVRIVEVPGAIGPRLVATCPLGMAWVNNEGVQLLDRGHVVQFLGAPIEFLFTPSTAVRVLYVGDAQELRVFTSTGTDYVYDLVAQAWSTDKHPAAPFLDAAVYNGGVTALLANGTVYAESTSYQDQALTSYAMRLKTGKITPAGVSGFSMLYDVVFTGEVMVSCALLVTITLYYDNTSSAETFTFTPAVGRLSEKVKVRHQRCTAFEVQIEESPASSGAAIRLEQITAWVGAVAGTNPLRAAGRGLP